MSGILFPFSQAWTPEWWFWHLLRLVAFLIATAFALYLFEQVQLIQAHTNEALQSEITGHKMAEEALQIARDELEVKVQERTSSLVNILQEAQEAINVLSTSANEVLTAISQLSSSTTETSTSVRETTTTVEEVRQTAQLSAKKAKDIAEAAQNATEVLLAGQANVEGAVIEMNHIRDQMGAIAETIVTLSEQSQAIGEITGTVNELAQQSNLLAVNAAIEAAQAGEQGKGFAVVAQEIKSLAEQSKQATAQVRGLLSDIQTAISNAVMATEQASKVVDTGVTQSRQAGESIRSAVDATANVARASTQIAASSQQQLIGVDQVATAMENINQASTQNAQTTKQVESVAQNLHELSRKLQSLVEQSPD
jgi:methyl-accepting chemotaxis protein